MQLQEITFCPVFPSSSILQKQLQCHNRNVDIATMHLIGKLPLALVSTVCVYSSFLVHPQVSKQTVRVFNLGTLGSPSVLTGKGKLVRLGCGPGFFKRTFWRDGHVLHLAIEHMTRGQ